MHGYALKRYIHTHTNYLWGISEGSLYPTLSALERQGLVRGSWEHAKQRKRKVFSLTEHGRAILLERAYELRAFTSLLATYPGFRELSR